MRRYMPSLPGRVDFALLVPRRLVVMAPGIGTNTLAGTGTGLALSVTVYGRIAPQATPSPGTYNDTIVVRLTY